MLTQRENKQESWRFHGFPSWAVMSVLWWSFTCRHQRIMWSHDQFPQCSRALFDQDNWIKNQYLLLMKTRQVGEKVLYWLFLIPCPKYGPSPPQSGTSCLNTEPDGGKRKEGDLFQKNVSCHTGYQCREWKHCFTVSGMPILLGGAGRPGEC